MENMVESQQTHNGIAHLRIDNPHRQPMARPDTRIIFTASSSLLIGMGVMMGSLCWLQEEALKQSAHDMQVMHEANKQLLTTLINHVENEES